MMKRKGLAAPARYVRLTIVAAQEKHFRAVTTANDEVEVAVNAPIYCLRTCTLSRHASTEVVGNSNYGYKGAVGNLCDGVAHGETVRCCQHHPL